MERRISEVLVDPESECWVCSEDAASERRGCSENAPKSGGECGRFLVKGQFYTIRFGGEEKQEEEAAGGGSGGGGRRRRRRSPVTSGQRQPILNLWLAAKWIQERDMRGNGYFMSNGITPGRRNRVKGNEWKEMNVVTPSNHAGHRIVRESNNSNTRNSKHWISVTVKLGITVCFFSTATKDDVITLLNDLIFTSAMN